MLQAEDAMEVLGGLPKEEKIAAAQEAFSCAYAKLQLSFSPEQVSSYYLNPLSYIFTTPFFFSNLVLRLIMSICSVVNFATAFN